MTAEEYAAPVEEQEKKMETESSPDSSGDEDSEAQDILVKDPGTVKALRATGPWPDDKTKYGNMQNASKKRKRKQKNFEQGKKAKAASRATPAATAAEKETTPAAASYAVDYENADFSQFSGKGQKQGNSVDDRQFNPFKNFHKNAKGGKGAGGKQKQRFRPGGGMSMSYKQK